MHTGSGRRAASDARQSGAAARTQRFPDGSLASRVPGLGAADRDVALFQVFPGAIAEPLLELLVLLRSVRAAAPRRLTAVLPYLAYGRADRPECRGEPVPARLIAELLEVAGAERLLAFDLHSAQLAGFFRIPVVELSALALLAHALREWNLADLAVLSPDLGAAKRAARLAAELECPLAVIAKQRSQDRVAVQALCGEVRGRSVVLCDDEIATGRTLIAAAQFVLARGARCACAVATHGVLPEGALERLERSPLERILVTDSIPLRRASSRLQVVSIAAELAAFLAGAGGTAGCGVDLAHRRV